MPILNNERHERFCQAIAAGISQTQAYIAAGFRSQSGKGAAQSASRLRRKPRIAERIAELRRIQDMSRVAAIVQAAVQQGCTLQNHLSMMARLRDEAREIGQLGAAINAEKNRGVALGYYATRNEHGNPGDFANLSDEALRKKFAEKIAQLEAEKATAKGSSG